jgi:hypothetical protein
MAYTKLGKVSEEPERLHEPKNNDNYYNAVQDTLDLTLHGDVPVHQIQQEANYCERDYNSDKWHFISPSFICILAKQQ